MHSHILRIYNIIINALLTQQTITLKGMHIMLIYHHSLIDQRTFIRQTEYIRKLINNKGKR